MPESLGARYKPLRVAFFLVLIFGVIPAAPLIADVNRLAGIPLQAPLAVLWLFMLTHAPGVRAPRGVPLALGLTGVGAIGVILYDNPADVRTWLGTLVVPLILFVGLQALGLADLRAARVATRYVLLIACAVQVAYYVLIAGAAAFTPSYAYAVHTDVVFWAEAGGRVLGNPNNASVVYCAAFAWAVAEIGSGQRLRLSRTFLLVSLSAVWCTGSRGAVLVALACLLALVLVRRRGGIRLMTTATAGLAILWLVNLWLNRFDTNRLGITTSVDSRLETRRAAVPQVLELPWGHGPGSTATAFGDDAARIFGMNSLGATSHDVFLNWGIALGWIGLALLLGSLFIGVRNSLRDGGVYGALPLVAFFLAAESAGIDVVNSSNPAWAMLMWVLIGLGWRGGLLPRRDQNPVVKSSSALESPVSAKSA